MEWRGTEGIGNEGEEERGGKKAKWGDEAKVKMGK